MKDSTCLIFHGPRRGGKSLSAVIECVIRMVGYNEKVFSNVPIIFDFIDDETGQHEHYESSPFDLDLLLQLDNTIEACTILWDEISLDASSRAGQNVKNRLIGAAITLMGKIDLSIVATLQFMRLLHVDLRDQMDGEVECFDLSFQYPYLKRGEMVSQTYRDISGRYTGKLYEKTGMEYSRTLHGKEFWGAYPTKFRYDVLEKIGTKYRLKMGTKVISNQSLAVPEDSEHPFDPQFKSVYDLTVDLAEKGAKLDKNELRAYCRKEGGVDLDDQKLGNALAQAGWVIRKGTRFYVKQ